MKFNIDSINKYFVNKKSIWLNYNIVAAIILITILTSIIAAALVTSKLPKKYTATSKLQLTKYNIPEIQPETTYQMRIGETASYVELVDDFYFNKLVLNEIKDKSKEYGNFSVKAKPIEDTEILHISVEASNPKDAKILADAAAKALIKKGSEIRSGSTKDIQTVIDKALKLANKELRKLRRELYAIQGSSQKVGVYQPFPKQLNKEDSIKATALSDKIDSKERFYLYLTNVLNKANFNGMFSRQSVLKVIYEAETPSVPSSPSWPRNIGIAFLVGLLAGIAILSGADSYMKANLTDKETS